MPADVVLSSPYVAYSLKKGLQRWITPESPYRLSPYGYRSWESGNIHARYNQILFRAAEPQDM